MAEHYNTKLINWLKKNKSRVIAGDISEAEAVEASGIDPGKIGPALWAAEPIAVPEVKIKANKSEIVKARKNGVRGERIAQRTGKSVAELKEIAGDDWNVRGGRGRPSGNGTGKAASGRRQKSEKKATSGRRNQKGTQSGPKRGRARTRAERMAKAGNPK